MSGFGSSDIVQDQSGNALANVKINVYGSLSDAKTQSNLLATATTNANGQWPLTVNGYDMVWARDPAGNIWPVASDTVAGDHAARLTALENTNTLGLRPYAAKSNNYSLALTDGIVSFNGASLTATLPDPTLATVGYAYTVKNLSSSALTVTSAGTSKTLDGAGSQSLAQWAKATYVSDGTQWLTV